MKRRLRFNRNKQIKRNGIYLSVGSSGKELNIHIPIHMMMEYLVEKEPKNASKIEMRKLSAREKEVFQLLLKGKCNKEMAQALNIAVRTIKFHMANILRKCNVENSRALLQIYGVSDIEEFKKRHLVA